MRHIKLFTLLIALSTSFLFSCDRDLETEGISRITIYPTFTMTGDEIVTVVKGATFTDPGIKAEEGGAALPITTTVVGSAYIDPARTQPAQVTYTTSNAVNTNVPGMYTITYSATNSDGFSGSATRIVFVLDKPADPTVDLSGNYTSSTSPSAVITKVANGVWYSTNVWGGGSTVKIGGYIISPDGINLNVPQQESLVRIYGYGTRLANGNLDLKMTRPTFSPPLVDQVKVWVKS